MIDAAAAVAAHGLGSVEGVELSDADADAFLRRVTDGRVLGVAVRMHEAGALELPARTAEALVERHDAAMARTLRVELTLLDVVRLLVDQGIDHRILKGAALAHTVATDPADREYRDVDVLVPSAAIDRTVDALADAGARRLQPRLSADFDRRFAKSVTMELEGVEVDVHRTLAPGPFGALLRPDDLFLHAHEFGLADETIRTLDATDQLLHACYHAALGSAEPVLTNLRDIALLAAGEWDRSRAEHTLARWRGAVVVARAEALGRRHAGLELELPVGDATPADHRLLDPYLRPEPRHRGMAMATVRVLPTSDRVAYLRALGIPEGSSLVDRFGELRRNIRRR